MQAPDSQRPTVGGLVPFLWAEVLCGVIGSKSWKIGRGTCFVHFPVGGTPHAGQDVHTRDTYSTASAAGSWVCPASVD